MSYKWLYRFLCRVRGALNVLINWTRAKAYPVSGGRHKRATVKPSGPVTATEQPKDYAP